MQWIFGCERQAKKMVSSAGCSGDPLSAAVSGCENQAAGAGNNCARLVLNVKAVERDVHGGELLLPGKATVAGAKNRPVGSDGPTAFLVRGKLDRVNRVPLRQWILPLPTRLPLRLERQGEDQGKTYTTQQGSREKNVSDDWANESHFAETDEADLGETRVNRRENYRD